MRVPSLHIAKREIAALWAAAGISGKKITFTETAMHQPTLGGVFRLKGGRNAGGEWSYIRVMR